MNASIAPATLRMLASTVLVGALTFVALCTWAGFSERPAGYLGPLAVSCVLVAVVGAAARAAHLPAAGVLLAQLLALGLWLNHHLADADAVLGWIPTPVSLAHSIDAFQLAVDRAAQYPAPVPASITGFAPVLVVLGSVIAFVVDALACTARRVPLAGLPLLAMCTAPVSMLDDGPHWWLFPIAAVLFAALLAIAELDRQGEWGRELDLTPDDSGGHSAVWTAAAKIGLGATTLATIAPLLVPALDGITPFGDGPGNRSGDNGVHITNPVLDLRRNLRLGADIPLLALLSNDPDPSYLRIAVLDEFDGEWKPSRRHIPSEQRANGELPTPVGLSSSVKTQRYEYQIRAYREFDSSWLPLPFPATQVKAPPGDWRYDTSTMDVLSTIKSVTTAAQSYTARGLAVEPTAADLVSAGTAPADLVQRYTKLDDSVPSWLSDLSDQVTAGAENDAERAVLLQQFFTQHHEDPTLGPDFTYDLGQSSKGSGIDELTDFLRKSRRGYCEQYAAAMALMARELGIPARVAIGFLEPEHTGANRYVFSAHDLHAWPELFFEGVGWVRFEPTPGSRAGAEPPTYTQNLLRPAAPSSQEPTQPVSPSASSSASAAPTKRPADQQQADTTKSGATGSGVPGWAWLLATLVVLAGLSLLPMAIRSLRRHRRFAAARGRSARSVPDLVEAAWAELRDTVIDLRLPWDDGATPRRRGADLAPRLNTATDPGASAALQRLVGLVEQARYARTAPSADLVTGLRDDVAKVTTALQQTVSPRAARRARWLPASLWRRHLLSTGEKHHALELSETR
ncbi:MAG: DUF3488 and transglutaminase-like domain-containing protein [Nocardioidaceae bacterium]